MCISNASCCFQFIVGGTLLGILVNFETVESRVSVVDIVTRLLAGRFWVLIPVGIRTFSLLQNI